jgi:hypothetical protein
VPFHDSSICRDRPSDPRRRLRFGPRTRRSQWSGGGAGGRRRKGPSSRDADLLGLPRRRTRSGFRADPAAAGAAFASIAQRSDVTADFLRTFLTTTHRDIANPKGMPNPLLLDYQVTEISAYILSLRKR